MNLSPINGATMDGAGVILPPLIHGDGITVAYQSPDGSDPFGSLDDDPGQVVGIN